MFDFTAPDNKNIASKIGLIQAPTETDQQFEVRIQHVFNHKKPGADSYIFGWIPVIYTNKGLSFFEAGATIIEEKDGVVFPTILLRKAFKTKSKWLLYTKEEVLKHELVHAFRCAFNEPVFEEFIAYSTSKNAFRRYFGPIFQNQTEIALFVIACILQTIAFNIATIGLFTGTFSYFLIRLIYRQKKFLKKIKKMASYAEIIGFTDEQIHN